MDEFEMLPEHLALLRRAYIRFDAGCEYGAPVVDPKRPYGNGDVEDDIRRILAEPSLDDARCRELHEQTATALQIVLRTGSFEPGRYVSDRYRSNWRSA